MELYGIKKSSSLGSKVRKLKAKGKNLCEISRILQMSYTTLLKYEKRAQDKKEKEKKEKSEKQ